LEISRKRLKANVQIPDRRFTVNMLTKKDMADLRSAIVLAEKKEGIPRPDPETLPEEVQRAVLKGYRLYLAMEKLVKRYSSEPSAVLYFGRNPPARKALKRRGGSGAGTPPKA
jgi:hypothetical protein